MDPLNNAYDKFLNCDCIDCLGNDGIIKSKRYNKYLTTSLTNVAKAYIRYKDERIFEILIHRSYSYIYSFICKHISQKDAIDDIMSITLEKIYMYIDSFNPEKATFETWSCKIAKNNTVQYLKEESKRKRFGTVSFDKMYDSSIMNYSDDDLLAYTEPNEYDFSFDDNMYVNYANEEAFKELFALCLKCVNSMSADYANVIKEKYIKNKKIVEISEDNNINMSTVKSILRRGVVRVAEMAMSARPTIKDEISEIKII